MTGSIVRIASRIGQQVNARSISSIVQPNFQVSGILIQHRHIAYRHIPAVSQLYRSSFYSTNISGSLKDNNNKEPVHPNPAPLDDLTHPIGLGAAGSVAPEEIVVAPPPPPPTGIVAKSKDFIRKGKEIVIQCKDGVKLLWTNKTIVKNLKKVQKEEGHQLTRREFQLIQKTDIDLMRLIPFGLVFILATEYIPLIIIFAPQLIPSTCVTQSQLADRRKKIHEKRSAMTEKLIRLNRREISKESLASYSSFIAISKKYGEGFEYKMIDREHMSSFCKFMGLNGLGPKFMLTKRLSKHMDYIRNDDLLLQKEGLDSLTFAELQLANEERGMRSLEVSKEHLEKSLAYWLKVSLSKETDVPPALMVFSRMFLLHSSFKSDSSKKN
ncbi:hypothetical protein BGZ76_006266 [Entomortierella beljakovae]|nr:hypothetical protein BGZ76_006266 [Entomortierella beljakovae]